LNDQAYQPIHDQRVKQLKTESSNPLLEGFGDLINKEKAAMLQAKTNVASLRQSSINGNPFNNDHFASQNQTELAMPLQQTTALGSLTQNF
jgi:hypothetical protein